MVNFIKCRLDLDGKWKETSKVLCDMLGYHEKELEKLQITELFHKVDQAGLRDFFKKIKQEDSCEWEAETEFKTKKGSSVSVQVNLTLIRNKHGNPEEVLCHILNLTIQKELEQKCRISKQQFESLFNYNPLPAYYYDLEGNFLDCNEKLAEFTGLSRNEIIGLNFDKFITGKDLERAKEQFQNAKKGQPSQYEIEVIIKDGVKRDIRVTKFPMYLEDVIAGVYGIFEDITEQRKREDALMESEQRFRSMFENNPHSVFYFDTEGTFLGANKKFEELSGYSEEELKQMSFAQFVHPKDLEKTLEHFKNTLNGEIQEYEITGITRSGDEREAHITNFPYLSGSEIIGVFGIAQDITEKKKAQEKLKESENRWQQLVEHNPQPVHIIQDGTLIFINQVGARYLGASSPKEVIGKSIYDFAHPEIIEKLLDRIKKLEQKQNLKPTEYKMLTLNGDTRVIEAHSIPIKYKGEDAIQTVMHDVTDLKDKQYKTRQSLKEKETLLQEIHHRVKNNLAVISGLLELQQMNITDKETISALQDSQFRIQSMAMIHEKLYQSETLHEIGFDAYLQELISSIRSTYNSSYKSISTEYDLTKVTLDLDQAIPCSLIVNEVIVNCYKHAFSKNDEGKINISLMSKGPKITLKITDNGKGLPADFDISQQQSLGTTLINVLSHQINGEMHLRNREQGKGTFFKLQFERETSNS